MEEEAIGGNPITGGKPKWTGNEWVQTDGGDLTGVTALSKSIQSIRILSMPDCGLGPKSMKILASPLSTAVVDELDISGNKCISGAKLDWKGDTEDGVDSDTSGITALSDSLQASKITNLNISNCGLGPESITILAPAFSTALVLESVDLSNNRFDPSLALLTDIEHVKLNLTGCSP